MAHKDCLLFFVCVFQSIDFSTFHRFRYLTGVTKKELNISESVLLQQHKNAFWWFCGRLYLPLFTILLGCWIVFPNSSVVDQRLSTLFFGSSEDRGWIKERKTFHMKITISTRAHITHTYTHHLAFSHSAHSEQYGMTFARFNVFVIACPIFYPSKCLCQSRTPVYVVYLSLLVYWQLI